MNYHGDDWKEQSRKCLERDNYTCRICKRPTKTAHHIIPYKISKNNNLSNLIALCKRCHTSLENKFRRVGFTRYVKELIINNARMEVERIIKKGRKK